MRTAAEIRAELIARDGPCCQFPDCLVTDGLTIHHVIPRQLGGGKSLANLCLICDYHHRTLNRLVRIPDRGQRKFLRPGYASALAAFYAALRPAEGVSYE